MLVHPSAVYDDPAKSRVPGLRSLLWQGLFLLTAFGCAGSRPTEGAGPKANTGGLETTQACVAALNSGDSAAAARFVDWDLWVAEDPALAYLVHSLKQNYVTFPATPDDRARRPIEHASVTVGELLDAAEPGPLLARSAEERFIVEAGRDFAPTARRTDAKLLDYHSDQRERSATLLMPNGEIVEARLVWTDGKYRLVPRW